MFSSTGGLLPPRILGALLLLSLPGCGDGRDVTFLEFRIAQNLELIRSSEFRNPAQVAIWLEDPASGQPSLLYRCELRATRGAVYTPELFGRTVPGANGEVTRELTSITSARETLESIEIRVVH